MASGTPVSDELGEVVGRCWHCPHGRQGLFLCWACLLCWPQKGTEISLGRSSVGWGPFLGRAEAASLY